MKKEDYAKLVELLKQAIADIRSVEGDELPKDLPEELLQQTVLLAAIMEPDHSKHHEHMVKAENPELEVNPHPRGADLHDKQGRRIESKCPGFKVSRGTMMVNFSIPPVKNGVSAAQRLEAILKDVDVKTGKRGYLMVTPKDTKQNVLQEYRFSNKFLREFFTRVDLSKKKCNKINLGGGTRCKKCLHFHRCKIYHELSEKMASGTLVTDKDWEKVLCRRIASQCP